MGTEYKYPEFKNREFASATPVGKDLTFLYNVAAGDTSNFIAFDFDSSNFLCPTGPLHIGANLTFKYNIRQLASLQVVFKYNVNVAIVGNTIRFLYDVTVPLASQINFAYDIHILAGRTSRYKYHIRYVPIGRTHSSQYDIHSLVPLPTTDTSYSRPLRPIVMIMSKDAATVHYIYNAFNPDPSLPLAAGPFTTPGVHIIGLDISLALGQAGSFQIIIEDHLGSVDETKIGLGNKVLITLGKEADMQQNLLLGYVRKKRVERPDTGVMNYILSGYGTQIRFNERITNFGRAAAREGFNSNLPRRTDEQMEADNLVRQLITDTDHLPIGDPPEAEFTDDAIDNTVNEFIPSIDERYTQWSSVMYILSDTVGAIWGVNADDAVFFKYPTTVGSGLVIKDIQEDNDRSDLTAYNIEKWTYEDSMEQVDGFANRLYGRGGALEAASAKQDIAANFVSLFKRALAVQFYPGSPRFTNISLMLSRVGTPKQKKLIGKIVQDFNNSPTGGVVATFSIDTTQVEATPDNIFKLDLHSVVPLISVSQPYWIILFACGQDANNTINWHHDDDNQTAGRYSAFSDPPGTDNTDLVWNVSSTGPMFTYVLFETQTHITEASDPLSIEKYGLVEAVIDANWIQENEIMDKFLGSLLELTAKPKRVYDINKITAPDKLIFPGQIAQIIDSLANLPGANIPGEAGEPVMAEIMEVHYGFDTNQDAFGCRFLDVRPVGYVPLGDFDADVSNEIFAEPVTVAPEFPIPVGSYIHGIYNVFEAQDPGPPVGPPAPVPTPTPGPGGGPGSPGGPGPGPCIPGVPPPTPPPPSPTPSPGSGSDDHDDDDDDHHHHHHHHWHHHHRRHHHHHHTHHHPHDDDDDDDVDDCQGDDVQRDFFGTIELLPDTYNSVFGVIAREWHCMWNNRKTRLLQHLGTRDPYDQDLCWRGTGSVFIDGNGVARMTGKSPRMYVFDINSETRWCNVEATVYCRREHENDENKSAGFAMGVRTNHQIAEDNIFNGQTYYAQMRYDGRIHFTKEIIHTDIGHSLEQPRPVHRNWWRKHSDKEGGDDGIQLPRHRWIGFKFIIRTQQSTGFVKLELWRDMTDGHNGGKWEKLIEYWDKGGWVNPKLTMDMITKAKKKSKTILDPMPERVDQIITRAGISIFVLNEGPNESWYKKWTIHEVDPLP